VAYFLIGWLVLGVSETWDFSYLLPIMPLGPMPVVEAAVVSAFWYATSGLVVLALGAYCSKEVNLPSVLTRAHLISGVIVLIWVVIILSIMGPIQAQSEGSPLYALSRVVFVRGILERADLLLYSSWIMGVTIELGTFFLAAVLILSDALGFRARIVWLGSAALASAAACMPTPELVTLAAVFDPLYIGTVILVVHIGLVGTTLLVSGIKGFGGD